MSIWGVQREDLAATVYGTVSGNDVSCTSSTKTTIVTSGALAAISAGPYYPLIFLSVGIVLGATAPSALVLGFQIGSGSSVDTFALPVGILANSAVLSVAVTLVGVNSATAWQGSGSTINITANATGEAITVKNVGTRAVVLLCRGPDL